VTQAFSPEPRFRCTNRGFQEWISGLNHNQARILRRSLTPRQSIKQAAMRRSNQERWFPNSSPNIDLSRVRIRSCHWTENEAI